MLLKRKIYDAMLQWKEQSCGNSALMIDGARRVGKSFIVEQFAEREYKSHIIIDFANLSPDLRDLFVHESHDLDLFFQKLSAFFSVPLLKRESLIVFDEVQQLPVARQLIKYLVADGRYDYIETGSLIRLKKNVQDIVIPSEEEHIEMFPLDFEEFLWALGDNTTMPLIKTCFEKRIPLGASLHRKVMNDFRQYMLVGGMPQAVIAYLPEKNFEEADRVKRRILTLYREDISKFAAGYEEKVFALFDRIPEQLSRKEKKFKLSSVKKTARNRDFESSFIWLNEALIVNACFNSSDPNVGLALTANHAAQKCYMGDTGLLVTMAFQDRSFTENALYKAILFDKLGVNEGMIMENVVAQALRASGHKLYFYSRNDKEHRENHMEIDFLLSKEKKICPVEVKSASYRSHASLDKFLHKFSARCGEPIILYGKDLMIKDGIMHLPVYMASLL